MTSWPALSSGLPCSWVRVRASPSGGFINAAEHSPSTLRRRLMSLLQPVNAFCAESIAWSSSALLQSGTCAKVLPLAGLITPTVFDPATALPFIVIVNSAIRTPSGLKDPRSGFRANYIAASTRCKGRECRRPQDSFPDLALDNGCEITQAEGRILWVVHFTRGRIAHGHRS